MFAREALSKFAKREEKSAPPVFVGRQAMIHEIIERANEGWQNNQQGEPGQTRIVQGAPGAGKSSLIAELAKKINKGDHATTPWLKDEPRILTLSNSEARSPQIVLRKLARLVDRNKARDLFAEKSKFWTAAIKVGVPEIGAEVSRSSETISRVPSATLSLFKEWLGFNNSRLKGPIIIAIDEAQNLPGDKDLPSSQLLQDIHENNSQLPISLFLAGLGDTRAHIASLGLTRGLTVHSIGRFEHQESSQLMREWGRHFGLVIGAQQQRLNGYCKLADDWPRHLHCAQKALAQVVVEKSKTQPNFDGKLDALTEQDWMRVTNQFAQYRVEYYRDRVSETMKFNADLVAPLMQSLNNQSTLVTMRKFVQNISAELSDPRTRQEAIDFCKHLIHQGAIQELPNSSIIHCPIPSFRTYLIETAKFPEKDKTYSIRCRGEIYSEGEFDSLSDAREWAMKQLDGLKSTQEVFLWQGAVAVDVMTEV